MRSYLTTLRRLTTILTFLAFTSACDPSGPKAVSGIRSAPAGDALTRIRRSQEVRAGWAPYAPYISLSPESQTVEGFYADLFEEVGKEAGLEVVWVESTWGTMISDLKAGKFDVMAAPVFRTIPRSLEVAFTRPIDYFGYSAIVRRGSRLQELEDFNREGVRIAVTQGEVGHDFATRHLPKAELVVHRSGDISLALVDVVQGRADVGICDAWTARQFAAEHSETVIDLFADSPFNVVGAGWFVEPHETALLQFLNASIDWLETTGTVRRVADEYQLPSAIAQREGALVVP